jgi:amino acid transporter
MRAVGREPRSDWEGEEESVASSTASPGLERNAIGLTEVLFQSITHMAPAVATALSIGLATTLAGGLTPLAVVFALIACLFTAYSMSQLAGRMSSAGGMYTYVTRGLGSFVGWLMAWAFTLAEPIVPAALFGAFGFFGASFITELTGYANDMLWLPLAILCGIVVWFLTYRGIEISTRAGVILGLIEIGIFLVISLLLVVNAPAPVTTAVFIPADGNIGPAFQGMVFCILAFVGFEAAAPLGEETREPRRTIPRAIVLSCVLIGLFYIFCYYAATAYFGPDRMQSDFLGFNEGNPWAGMANAVLPTIGSLLVTFAIVNSCLANSNAGALASTRSIFSLGRARLLPGALAAIHPRYQTPVNAVHAQGVIGIVLAVVLGFLFAGYSSGGPITTYGFIGTCLGLLFAAMYVAVNAAAIGYFLREGRSEFHPVKHAVVPVLGIIAMVVGFLSALGGVTIPILNMTISPLPEPYSFAPLVVGVWMVIGVVLYFVLQARSPAAIGELGAAVAEG